MTNKYQSGRYALHLLELSGMEPMRKQGLCTVVNHVLAAGSVACRRGAGKEPDYQGEIIP